MSEPDNAIQLLIVDLDNTLYDWISSFVPALMAMVQVAAPHLGISISCLQDELREVHQKHGNSEHPYALLETKSVLEKFGVIQLDNIPDCLDEALHKFNSVRKGSLKLYDGVRETLSLLVEKRIPVVAYTDAKIQNSLFRLERMDLAPLISRVYAPQSRYEIPRPKKVSNLIRHDFVAVLPAEDKKPNPQTLLDICKDYHVEPSCAVYVGDSLSRDIFMAKKAGVRAAWAKYGTEYDKELWPLLVQVTHWTEADILAEVELRKLAHEISPDVELTNFNQLLDFFNFSIGSINQK